MNDKSVTFRWKDYAHHNRPRTLTLDGKEFLRRFLMHAVPRGFMRIRHFGLLANRVRSQNLATCRRLLNTSALVAPIVWTVEPLCCPACGRGHLIAGPRLSPQQLAAIILRLDSS